MHVRRMCDHQLFKLAATSLRIKLHSRPPTRKFPFNSVNLLRNTGYTNRFVGACQAFITLFHYFIVARIARALTVRRQALDICIMSYLLPFDMILSMIRIFDIDMSSCHYYY